MTSTVCDSNYALSLLGIMMLTATDAMAALSGRVETSVDTNNSQFHPETSVEERLDLTYSDPEKGITGGLSLALFQRPGEKGGETYQLFIQQDFNNTQDQVSLGRFFRADTLGYYSLDGVQYRHRADTIIFNFYHTSIIFVLSKVYFNSRALTCVPITIVGMALHPNFHLLRI